jgi:transcriptional regulator with XRE-family HTH domain
MYWQGARTMTVQLMTPIGANLRKLRRAADLTQQQLAVAAGLSVSVVSQIEQGSNPDPRGSTLAALAASLKVTVDDLLRAPSQSEANDDGKPAGKKGQKRKES